MLYNFIVINFAPLAGLLFLFIFLFLDDRSDRKIRDSFVLFCFMELIEIIFYSLELWTASFAEPTVWRILFSAVGYGIRPFLMIGIIYLEAPEKLSGKRKLLVSIPALVNLVVVFSAFFTDLAYSYNAENELVRGPLGYTTHIVLLFYLAVTLVSSIMNAGKGQKIANSIIWAICFVITIAMVLEILFPVHSLGRTAIVLSTAAYYLYFQTQMYHESMKEYMVQTIDAQKEHLREMNIINVLAKEYVTVCYVDVKKNCVIPYRMDPFIEKQFGETLRSGVTFEEVFRAYLFREILEEDRDFFLDLSNLKEMRAYLKLNGSLSKNYRVLRDGRIIYCEMRAELVSAGTGNEGIVFGFSNNDSRVRKEMVYQSAVQQEMDRVKEARESLAPIADLARQLQEAIEDKLSSL